MWWRERSNLFILCLVFLFSCKSEKRYEDFNENDFYEVQGAITKVYSTSSIFDSSSNKLMNFVYCINDSVILKGSEKELYQAWRFAQPIVVLVHKDDPKINFFARVGLTGSMNSKQAKMIDDILEVESKIQRTN